MKPRRNLGAFSILASTFLYGFYAILARLIGFKIPLFYGSFMRNSFGMIILLLLVLIYGKWKPVKKPDIVYIVLRSILGVVGFLGSFIPLLYIPVGTFYFVNYAGVTVGGYVLGKLIMKDHITKIKFLSLVLALTGLFFIYSFAAEISKTLYIILAFAGGLCIASWNIFSKKVSGTYSALQLNLIDFVLFGFFVLIISFILREQWTVPQNNTAWIASLGLSVIFVVTGQLLIYGFKYLDSQIASLLLLTEILFGILFAFLFFGETVSIMTLIGGMFILSAIILPQVVQNRTAPKHY